MKTKIFRIGKKSLSVIISLMMIVSTMLVGMVTANASDTKVTIYFTPSDSWLNNNYTIKANFKYGSQNTEWDKSNAAVDTNKTIGSKKVYTVSFVLKWDGLYNLQLLAFDSSNTQKESTDIYSGSWYPYSNYNNKYWNGSSWVEPSWDSGSGETDNYDTHIYALTTQSANMKLHAWNVNSSGLSDNSNNPMSLVATYNNGSKDFYLWKIGYNMQTSNPNFFIYSNVGNLTNETKLTNEVTGVTTEGDYFFDLKDTELGKPSKNSATGTYKPLTVSGSLTTSNTFNAGDSVDLSTAFTGLTITGSVYEYLNSAYTTTYAIDGKTVSSPWTATAGTHTITATVSGGKNTSNNVFESVSTTDASFTVNSSSTPTATYYYSYWNSSKSEYIGMNYDADKNLYKFTTNSEYLKDSRGFKITTSNNKDNDPANKDTLCVNKFNPKPNLTASPNAGVSLSYESEYDKCVVSGSGTEFIITYDPTATSVSSNGEIKVWSVQDYEGTTAHSITVTTPTNGKVECAKTSANKDEEVSFDVTPNTGYEIGTVTIKGVETPNPSVSDNTSTYTFTMPDADVEITVTFTAKNYTVTYGTGGNGTGSITAEKDGTALSDSPATVAYNSSVIFKATAAQGFKFSGWYSDAECNNVIQGANQTSTEYTATITANTKVYAKFIPEGSPSQQYFLFHCDSHNDYKHHYDPMSDDDNDGVYTIKTSGFILNNGYKFKITNSNLENDTEKACDSPEYAVNLNTGYTLMVSPALQQDRVTLSVYTGDNSKDFVIGNTTRTDFIIKYTPSPTNNGLSGVVYLAYANEAPASKLTVSPTTANLCVNQTLQLTKTHTDHDTCNGTVTFESSAPAVATVDASGLVKAVAKGTATITAKCAGGETATCTVTVSAIPNEQSDRIYAYAGTDATPKAQGWIAAEYAAAQQKVYNNDNEIHETGASQFPSLGATNKTELRLFLPTSASPEQVVLYNSFSYDIKINNTTIPKGDKATVSYTPGATYDVYKVTGDNSNQIKTLTIYKSEAQGALYLNNTGKYSSFDNDGVPAMLRQLYLGKDDGEIGEGLGNAGAYSDSSGVVNEIGVKKIKGRGNSTWKYTDKKSFNVTFDKAFNGFGFTKGGKKYSLLANYKDASLSRNKIIYQLAEYMGAKYVPDVATIDLYMNGLYMGSYLMCQKIEVGSKEVVNDLDSETLLDTKTATASDAEKGFSFLMELDSNATTGADYLITVGEQKITLKEPEYLDDNNNKYNDALTTAIDTFVTDKYTELYNALNNNSLTYDELNEIIDVESLAKFYLLNELAKNYDIGVTSTYFVYNKTEGKFFASPIWDMDVTTSNCEKLNNYYGDYDHNWTNDNSSHNRVMKLVFNNAHVQSAARAIWTEDYYTGLVNEIKTIVDGGTLANGKTVAGAKEDIKGSYENNFTKWSSPKGFNGQDDNVQPDASLKTASYDINAHSYTVNELAKNYEELERVGGQIDFVRDWLISRAAWMTQKYNKYYIPGINSWDNADTMEPQNGINTYTLRSLTGGTTYAFKICSDGGLETDTITNSISGEPKPYRDSTSTSISYDKDVKLVNNATSRVSSFDLSTDGNNNFTFTTNASVTSDPLYIIYDQVANQVTLSDTAIISSAPVVTLSGTTLTEPAENDEVTLTAQVVTAAKINSEDYTGDYTIVLYKNDVKVTEKTAALNESVTFTDYIGAKTTTYRVEAYPTTDNTLVGKSTNVSYPVKGVASNKIYFDPSTYSADWNADLSPSSTVTMVINNDAKYTYTMIIDPDDVNALKKGVYRAVIDDEALALLQNTATPVKFTLDSNPTLIASTTGNANITDGWIYNYSSQTGGQDEPNQQLWEQYNVDITAVTKYPTSKNEAFQNITKYNEFKAYLADQVEAGKNTDNIVYFDNSASNWYNVYIYDWNASDIPGHQKDAILMNKLPYADIWYYDFGSVKPAANFLFKDRSGPGFGSNYQQTVDLNGTNYNTDFVRNGNNEQVFLNFEGTIDTPNPLFVTENFYNCTKKNVASIENELKYRAFNTEWQEFAEVIKNDVQTKAIDVYFDAHRSDITDIALYHTSTNNKFKFAADFTRLTQLGDSTIYHAKMQLPYTDLGIAFRFDKFVVNDGSANKPEYTMSSKVQPKLTCFNTGEVWYEVNDTYKASLASTANLLAANSPLLTATSTDIYLIGDMNTWTESDTNWQLSSTDGNMYTGTFTISGGSSAISFKVFDSSNSGNKYFANGNYQFNSSNTVALGLKNNVDTPDMSIKPIATSGDITLNVKYYRVYNNQTRLEITQTVATGTTIYIAGDFNGKTPKQLEVYNGSKDNYAILKATSKTYKGYTVYVAENVPAGNNTHLRFVEDNIRWDDIATNPKEKNNNLCYFSSDDKTSAVWTSELKWDSSENDPKLRLSAINNTITLNNGTATTNLSVQTENVPDGTAVEYVITPESGATVVDNVFTATVAGTYTVKAKVTVGGTEYSSNEETITVNAESTEPDYCGILAYNHSTATFASTAGGKIDSAKVELTGGYYQNDAIPTGYTTFDGDKYIVIYALPTADTKDGAVVNFKSVTSKADDSSQMTFDGWTKDGTYNSGKTTLTDIATGTATVAYLANWSEIKMVQFEFTYEYDVFDTSKSIEYKDGDGYLTTNSNYKISVMIHENPTKDEVEAEFAKYLPRLESDYFDYSFSNVAINVDLDNKTAVAKANKTVKTYKVSINGDDGIVPIKKDNVSDFNYQNVATVFKEAPPKKVTVWTDSKGHTLYVGNTYKFRVTKDVVIYYSFKDSESIQLSTFVNDATYEFFTSGTTEKVRINILVDNYLGSYNKKDVKFGTLYFFTDSTGKPTNSLVSPDVEVDVTKLQNVALSGSSSNGIYVKDQTEYANAQNKYFFKATMSNTAANREKYIRVYSYIIYTGEDNKEHALVSKDYVLASIKNAV